MTKPIAWSHTALTQFETCPKQFYHLKVAKDVQDTKGEAALWGQRVHEHLEHRVKHGTALPESTKIYEPLVQTILARVPPNGRVLTEQQWAIDENMAPVEWFDKRVWLRCVVDVGFISGDKALLLDYKTGKRKLDGDQMRLFALMGFAQFPELQAIGTGYIWLATGDFDTQIYHRYEVAQLWETFLPRVARLKHAHATASWPPRPSGLCRGWCAVKSCEFYQEKNR